MARRQERAQGRTRGEKAAGMCEVDYVDGQESSGFKSATSSRLTSTTPGGTLGLSFSREAALAVSPHSLSRSNTQSFYDQNLSFLANFMATASPCFQWMNTQIAASVAQVNKAVCVLPL